MKKVGGFFFFFSSLEMILNIWDPRYIKMERSLLASIVEMDFNLIFRQK